MLAACHRYQSRGRFIPAPEVGKHGDRQFGTHHAKDAWHLFRTLGLDLNLFSSAIKLNTQYMHSIWFNLRVRRAVTRDEVLEKLQANPYVALTEKTMASTIFSFGRDHGYFGRLLNQTVVSTPTLIVRDGHEITGFCFTPQDGNSLLSSIAAAAWFLDPEPMRSTSSSSRPTCLTKYKGRAALSRRRWWQGLPSLAGSNPRGVGRVKVRRETVRDLPTLPPADYLRAQRDHTPSH